MNRFSSHSQPLQDLAGVKTWVQKTRQDGVQDDTSAPDKSREDYAKNLRLQQRKNLQHH